MSATLASPIMHDVKQGTVEWHILRMGRATSSRFREIMTPKTRKPSKSSDGYINDLLAEYAILRNLEKSQGFCDPLAQFGFSNRATDWGNEQEPVARQAYEERTGLSVTPVGFISHGDGLLIGASTDGLVGDEGLIEIKCPYGTKRHIETVRGGLPDDHLPQIQGALWLTGRDWCDFGSFDPRVETSLNLYVQRVYRDESYISDLESCVLEFHERYMAEFRQLSQRGNQ